MTDLTPPPVTPDGNYDPIILFTFLEDCRTTSVPATDIAKCLRLPVHRVHYAMGPGFEMFRRRAQTTAAERMLKAMS